MTGLFSAVDGLIAGEENMPTTGLDPRSRHNMRQIIRESGQDPAGERERRRRDAG
ncbi:hypothetical protein [Streptomyces sp. NPDC002825]|uniref:hypothetical protein n=1 Tax=Streptomyces sp. NPDC002825 TaxID=3154666 RepID=UPI003323B6C6